MGKVKIEVNGLPFLGREKEQDEFRDALQIVIKERKLLTKVTDWVDEKKPPLPFVFLLYGEGGMGKTYLTKRFRDIADDDKEFKGHITTLLLDWEKRRDLDYSLKARDAVSPEKIFEHIYAIFRDGNFGKKFTEYEQAKTIRAEAEKKVSEALEKTTERGERFKIIRELGGKGIAWLIRSGIVSGIPIPFPEEPIAKAFEEIIGKGAEAIALARETATTLINTTLENKEMDLFINPIEKLAHSLANGIRESALKKPIVLFLDTYEIIDRADIWVREVIKRSSPNVVWVVSGRDNLAGTRKYGTGYFTGYEVDFPRDRLQVFALSELEIDEVFTYLQEYVPDREVNIEIAKEIHEATLGIPLAVQAAAAMWKSNTKLNDIVGGVPETVKRDEIVKLMTERFLLHCFDDSAHPNDLFQIYALALAYQPDAELLQEIFETESLEQDLSELERRHSFVFLSQMKLHSSVQAFLREYLLQKIRRPSKNVRNIHQRAVNYLIEKCSKIESETPLLEDLIEDELWKETRLGLIHHTFWLNSTDGWDVFLPPFAAGLMYDQSFARACIEILNPISILLQKREKQRLKVMGRGIKESTSADNVLLMLGRVQKLNSSRLGTNHALEIPAIYSILRGNQLIIKKRYEEALTSYEDAEKNIPDNSKKLEERLGSALYDVADILNNLNLPLEKMWFKSKLVTIIEKAIMWMPDNYKGYKALGYILEFQKKYDDALDSFKKAIDLNQEYSPAYYGIAVVHKERGNIDGAIKYCKKALKIDPNNWNNQNGLGYLYNKRGEYHLAIKHLEKIVKEATFPYPLINYGITNFLLGNKNKANSSFQKVIKLPKEERFIDGHGWVKIVLGDFDEGMKLIKDAFNRANYIGAIQNIYDWTMLISKAQDYPEGVTHLLEFIATNPSFKDIRKTNK